MIAEFKDKKWYQDCQVSFEIPNEADIYNHHHAYITFLRAMGFSTNEVEELLTDGEN